MDYPTTEERAINREITRLHPDANVADYPATCVAVGYVQKNADGDADNFSLVLAGGVNHTITPHDAEVRGLDDGSYCGLFGYRTTSGVVCFDFIRIGGGRGER